MNKMKYSKIIKNMMSEKHRSQADYRRKDSIWLHAYQKFKTPPYYMAGKGDDCHDEHRNAYPTTG
uniref:hypothetical protein n=1 Tax=Agathobacter sp. TaxID=2021311 RepID=UPI004055C9DC